MRNGPQDTIQRPSKRKTSAKIFQVRILGTLNGYATAFSGLGRAVGPAVTGAVFSIGVQRGYVIAPWWLLAGIAILGAVPAWFIIEGDGPSRRLDTDSDTDSDSDGEEETLVTNSEDEDGNAGGARDGLPTPRTLECVSDSEEGISSDDERPLKRGGSNYGTVSG